MLHITTGGSGSKESEAATGKQKTIVATAFARKDEDLDQQFVGQGTRRVSGPGPPSTLGREPQPLPQRLSAAWDQPFWVWERSS